MVGALIQTHAAANSRCFPAKFRSSLHPATHSDLFGSLLEEDIKPRLKTKLLKAEDVEDLGRPSIVGDLEGGAAVGDVSMRAMVAEVEMKEEESSGEWVTLAWLQALPSEGGLTHSAPRCYFWAWRPSTAETAAVVETATLDDEGKIVHHTVVILPSIQTAAHRFGQATCSKGKDLGGLIGEMRELADADSQLS